MRATGGIVGEVLSVNDRNIIGTVPSLARASIARVVGVLGQAVVAVGGRLLYQCHSVEAYDANAQRRLLTRLSGGVF